MTWTWTWKWTCTSFISSALSTVCIALYWFSNGNGTEPYHQSSSLSIIMAWLMPLLPAGRWRHRPLIHGPPPPTSLSDTYGPTHFHRFPLESSQYGARAQLTLFNFCCLLPLPPPSLLAHIALIQLDHYHMFEKHTSHFIFNMGLADVTSHVVFFAFIFLLLHYMPYKFRPNI